jgi:hypothetical protein
MDPTVSIRLSNSNINQIIKYMYNRYSWWCQWGRRMWQWPKKWL